MKDIGPKVAESIHDWFNDKRNIRLIEKLDKVGVEIQPFHQALHGGKFKGQSFVFTGTLETVSREEAKEKIRNLGGEASESVSKKTSYVVFGSEPGSKFEKAKKLGVATINEQEFLKLIK